MFESTKKKFKTKEKAPIKNNVLQNRRFSEIDEPFPNINLCLYKIAKNLFKNTFQDFFP